MENKEMKNIYWTGQNTDTLCNITHTIIVHYNEHLCSLYLAQKWKPKILNDALFVLPPKVHWSVVSQTGNQTLQQSSLISISFQLQETSFWEITFCMLGKTFETFLVSPENRLWHFIQKPIFWGKIPSICQFIPESDKVENLSFQKNMFS